MKYLSLCAALLFAAMTLLASDANAQADRGRGIKGGFFGQKPMHKQIQADKKKKRMMMKKKKMKTNQ